MKTWKYAAILKITAFLNIDNTSHRFSSAVQECIRKRCFSSKTFCPMAPAPDPHILCSQASGAPCTQEQHSLPRASSTSFLPWGDKAVTWGFRLPEDLFPSTSYSEGWDNIWGTRPTDDNNSCWHQTFSNFHICYCVMINAKAFYV